MLRVSLWPRLTVAASLCLSLALPARSQTAEPTPTPTPPPPASASAANVAPASSSAADPAGGQAPLADTILVTGQRPGPGLWKVTKDDHVLWVFGTYAPLPKNLEWRSQQVEAILAHSQEYLLPPNATADVGFFSKVAMLPFAIGVTKNPGGAQLKDLVPAPVYARWLVLKTRYLGADDDIERERPIFAADALYQKGLEQAGLGGGAQVQKKIDSLVKQSGIRKTVTGIKLAVDDPVAMLREFKKTPLEDAACFTNTLARLEDDIDAMRVRANAWSRGDLAAIEKLSYADRRGACITVLNSTVMQNRPGMRAIESRLQESWLAAAEKSLAANSSTFATLPLNDLLDAKGVMALLQARGYVVEKPE